MQTQIICSGYDSLTEKENTLKDTGLFLYQVGNRFCWKRNDDEATMLCSGRKQAASFFFSRLKRGLI